MIKKRCKMTFVVHGSTIYTTEERLYDNSEYPPLDENGKYEIAELCHWLKKRSPKTDEVYAAPTMRAVQSAKIISKSYNQDFEILDCLRSKKEGIWSGYSFGEIEKKYPELLKSYKQDIANFCCPNGESFKTYNDEIFELIKKIKEKDFGKRIIIVCDATLVRGIIAKTFSIPIKNQNKINLQTGSATQINFYQDWEILVYANYVPL